ncbi:hypothetical protein [Litorimonas haliclonae]|uniref:hypothetical protein n=1 Tax=Litorimonas haliclonae TaxID=2081977 RepID=UPI0039F09248
MSGKSKEEIAFELVSKLKGVGVWGENNMDQILDMYAECLEATSGMRNKKPAAQQPAAPSQSAPPQFAPQQQPQVAPAQQMHQQPQQAAPYNPQSAVQR